jgi:hypothetical protein
MRVCCSWFRWPAGLRLVATCGWRITGGKTLGKEGLHCKLLATHPACKDNAVLKPKHGMCDLFLCEYQLQYTSTHSDAAFSSHACNRTCDDDSRRPAASPP